MRHSHNRSRSSKHLRAGKLRNGLILFGQLYKNCLYLKNQFRKKRCGTQICFTINDYLKKNCMAKFHAN